MIARKYDITSKTHPNNPSLHRIIALRSFGNVREGELGGWIANAGNLSHADNCWVFSDALVYDHAQVFGNAQVYGHAQVFGSARVFGSAYVRLSSVNGNKPLP